MEAQLYTAGITKLSQLATMAPGELAAYGDSIDDKRAEMILMSARLAMGDPAGVSLLYGGSSGFKMENSRIPWRRVGVYPTARRDADGCSQTSLVMPFVGARFVWPTIS